jgi:predicted nucleic acid-binding protein
MTALVVPGVVVVDASLVAMWVLAEPLSAQATSLAREWDRAGIQPIAPCFMLAEVTNAIYRRALRGQIPFTEAEAALDVVLDLGIGVDEAPDLHRQALRLARRLQRPTSYDAHYLALGERRGCEVWTGDERLYNAVSGQIPWLRWIGTYVSLAAGP